MYTGSIRVETKGLYKYICTFINKGRVSQRVITMVFHAEEPGIKGACNTPNFLIDKRKERRGVVLQFLKDKGALRKMWNFS